MPIVCPHCGEMDERLIETDGSLATCKVCSKYFGVRRDRTSYKI